MDKSHLKSNICDFSCFIPGAHPGCGSAQGAICSPRSLRSSPGFAPIATRATSMCQESRLSRVGNHFKRSNTCAIQPFPRKLTVIGLQNTHMAKPYAQIAFQLLRKLRRIMAPHFSNTSANTHTLSWALTHCSSPLAQVSPLICTKCLLLRCLHVPLSWLRCSDGRIRK